MGGLGFPRRLAERRKCFWIKRGTATHFGLLKVDFLLRECMHRSARMT